MVNVIDYVYDIVCRSTLGRKSAASTCIFSGSKGEAFAAEPLLVSEKFPLHRFAETFVVAVVSLNKVLLSTVLYSGIFLLAFFFKKKIF